MNKGIIFILLCFSSLSCAFSQPGTVLSHPDAIARAAPDSAETSIQKLSAYFNANLHSQKELIRAFYFWTANEILYDVENMFTFRSAEDPARLVVQTLQERKAVCQGYAEFFHELCENAGIESYIVPGYTRQNGSVVTINHAWVLARIDTGWYFFDPTWGSGFLLNGKFIRRFTSEYFMVTPAVFIKSHMPFDPMWQCLYHPVTSAEFSRGTLPGKNPGPNFSFPDSIAEYEQLPKSEKFSETFRRVQQNGVNNNSIFEYQRYLRQNIEVEEANRQNDLQNQRVMLFNEAVDHYNTASVLFNYYINYWNRQFKPTRPDAEIRKMIDTCNYHLAESRRILASIIPREETLSQNMEVLLQAIRENQKHVDEQGSFLTDYFNTPKAFRGSLFRKYTWMGVPVK